MNVEIRIPTSWSSYEAARTWYIVTSGITITITSTFISAGRKSDTYFCSLCWCHHRAGALQYTRRGSSATLTRNHQTEHGWVATGSASRRSRESNDWWSLSSGRRVGHVTKQIRVQEEGSLCR